MRGPPANCTGYLHDVTIRWLSEIREAELGPQYSRHIVFVIVCRTESEAENFIEGSAERLWALVVFDSGPNELGAGMSLSLSHSYQLFVA